MSPTPELAVNDAGKPIIGEDIIRRQEFAICEQGIHYMGWTTDGNLFSSSVVVKQPVSWSEDERKKLSIVDRELIPDYQNTVIESSHYHDSLRSLNLYLFLPDPNIILR